MYVSTFKLLVSLEFLFLFVFCFPCVLVLKLLPVLTVKKVTDSFLL